MPDLFCPSGISYKGRELNRRACVPYYKFLKAKYAAAIVPENRLRMGSLSYYRKLFETEGAGIGDRLEGAVEHKSGDRIFETVLPSHRPGFRNFGITIDEEPVGGKLSNNLVVTGNVAVTHIPDIPIFCYSDGDLDPLARYFAETEGYDACYRIEDIDGLARSILQDGVIEETGEPVRHVFHKIEYGKVEYRTRSADAFDETLVPHPLLKEVIFAPQSEARLFLRPKRRFEQSIITVRAPDLSPYFKREF